MRAHGLKIDGATNVMCDNQAAVSQVTKHDALLKKRHVAISWERVRESVRRGEMGVVYCRILPEGVHAGRHIDKTMWTNYVQPFGGNDDAPGESNRCR